jgi:hypothetical protein
VLQLSSPSIRLWSIRYLQQVQRAVRMSCGLGWPGLPHAPFVIRASLLRRGLISYVECDSLADGVKRRLRKDGEQCQCKDGWGGTNCNGASTDLSAVRHLIALDRSLQDESGVREFPSSRPARK